MQTMCIISPDMQPENCIGLYLFCGFLMAVGVFFPSSTPQVSLRTVQPDDTEGVQANFYTYIKICQDKKSVK